MRASVGAAAAVVVEGGADGVVLERMETVVVEECAVDGVDAVVGADRAPAAVVAVVAAGALTVAAATATLRPLRPSVARRPIIR